jgi:hypothetical protein
MTNEANLESRGGNERQERNTVELSPTIRAYVKDRIAANRPAELKDFQVMIPDISEEQAMSVFAAARDNADGDESIKGFEDEFIGIRHSRAKYDRVIQRTDDFPMEKIPFLSAVSARNFDDVSEKGKVLIHGGKVPDSDEVWESEADKLLKSLNPATDVLYIASSPVERAAQTAVIYTQKAREMGFQIVDHGDKDIVAFGPEGHANESGKRTLEAGQGVGVRKFDQSMPAMEALLPSYIADVFTPADMYDKKYLNEDKTPNYDAITGLPGWQAMPEEAKQKWLEARRYVDANNKGSWGENYYHHSEHLAKMFPEIPLALEVSQKRLAHYGNLFTIVRDSFRQDATNSGKNLKMLIFTHEESFGALENIFGEGAHAMKNCEPVRFRPNDKGDYTILKRDKLASAHL